MFCGPILKEVMQTQVITLGSHYCRQASQMSMYGLDHEIL